MFTALGPEHVPGGHRARPFTVIDPPRHESSPEGLAGRRVQLAQGCWAEV